VDDRRYRADRTGSPRSRQTDHQTGTINTKTPPGHRRRGLLTPLQLTINAGSVLIFNAGQHVVALYAPRDLRRPNLQWPLPCEQRSQPTSA
jgi:hypothetical protein